MKRMLNNMKCLLVVLAWMLPGLATAVAIPAIRLEQREQLWTVEYEFERPVREFRFARTDVAGNRARQWKPVDEDFVISPGGEGEVVKRKDGRDFTTTSFAVEPRFIRLDGDYAPFAPFSDGGLLVHTGRFFACAPACGNEGGVVWTISASAPESTLIVHASKFEGEVTFKETGDGSNVYVGRADPIETDHLMAVVDRQFPGDARRLLQASFPRMMSYYAERLGALPRRPSLFASYDPDGSAGQGAQGGVLPGQVFIHMYGPHSGEADAITGTDKLLGFFAHEAAHLYQRVPPSVPARDWWLHEGGAEAFSLLATEAVGAAGEAAAARVAAAMESCGSHTRGMALSDATQRGGQASYQCGLLIQLVIDAAVRTRSGGKCDLFGVWREFHARLDRGQSWTKGTFRSAVADVAGPKIGQFVEAAVEGVHADPADFYKKALEAAKMPDEGQTRVLHRECQSRYEQVAAFRPDARPGPSDGLQ